MFTKYFIYIILKFEFFERKFIGLSREQEKEIADRVIELTNNGTIQWERIKYSSHQGPAFYIAKFKDSVFRLENSGTWTLTIDFALVIDYSWDHLWELELAIEGALADPSSRYDESKHADEILKKLSAQ